MPWLDDWDEELYAEGYDIGGDWAQQRASRGELRRLTRFYESLQPLDWDTWWISASGQVSEPLALMEAIDPDSKEDRQAASEYWHQIVGRDDSEAWESEFALGFVEGALELEPSTELVDEDVDDLDEDAEEPENASSQIEKDEDVGKERRSIQINPRRSNNED